MASKQDTSESQGRSHPLGARLTPDGANFSVYSKGATAVDLLFFDDADDARPSRVITLDPRVNRTYHYWHVEVPDIEPGQLYGYRVYGPHDPARGWRFDSDKVLIDPYARAVVVPHGYSRRSAGRPGDNAATAMKSAVTDVSRYDWQGDAPLHRPFAQTVIYEMHVAGFTRHPNSGVAPPRRGTYAGLVEKIPYLKGLGITAVELLPVFQFDPQNAPAGLPNYWGYTPVSFFAPHAAYSSAAGPLGPLDEFRDMVKALHRAGIEVILDVVYNHTAEGSHTGPTLCYRGLDNAAYYRLDPANPAHYADYTGTGNTLNANHPTVRRMIVDSLRYWVSEMHVDGFRFDLASILSRDETGTPLANPPILLQIESDPVLAGTKLIAEAWDAAGLYQVGSFVGDAWKEWNGKFRDDIRAFLKGDRNSVARLPDRVLGSPDLYAHKQREADQSVNFVTCHDGFTLNDLVSYDHKHNEANREGNRDGNDHNLSWNCGVEGPTDDPLIEDLRNRQVKNFLTMTLLSMGTPMLLMGDEVRRTQGGNNNAYCQDNPISWFDWSLVDEHGDVLRFVQHLVRFRLNYDMVRVDHRLSLNQFLQQARITWHGIELDKPDVGPDSHSIAVTLENLSGTRVTHFMVNAFWEELDFELPEPPGDKAPWHRIIDTSRPWPDDILIRFEAPVVEGSTYPVPPRSIVVLDAVIPAPAIDTDRPVGLGA